jgi:hypothetical protein
MRVRRALEITLGVVVILLLWQIGAAWRRPLPPLLPPPAVTPGQITEAALPVQATLDSMAPQVQLIAEKNLFDPNRGRVEVTASPEEGPKEVPPPSHLKLVGVVVSQGRAEALFTDATQGGKVVRVKQGDTFGAYQLVAVTPTATKLSLGAGGGEVTLSLMILESAQAAQAPRLMPLATPQPAARARSRVGASRVAAQEPTPNPDDENVPQEEAQELRENIQKMQQRLRQIRRRAAIEEARARGESIEEEEAEEEED